MDFVKVELENEYKFYFFFYGCIMDEFVDELVYELGIGVRYFYYDRVNVKRLNFYFFLDRFVSEASIRNCFF